MSLFGPLVRAGAAALRPLDQALSDPEALTELLGELGWAVPLDDTDLEAIAALLPLRDALARLQEPASAQGDAALLDAAELLADVASAVSALAQLDAGAVAALPMELREPERLGGHRRRAARPPPRRLARRRGAGAGRASARHRRAHA